VGRQKPIGYVPAPDAYERMTVMLRDWKPMSMLRVPVHQVDRARFPVIDMHTHFNDAEGVALTHAPVDEILRVMDACNIERAVILTGMWGERLQAVIDEHAVAHPDRFTVFAQLDDLWARLEEPGFAALMLDILRDAVDRGARGLKLNNHLGLDVRDSSGALVAIDDPRFDVVWAEAGRLSIPVSIHVADPDAFFVPNGPDNERYEELTVFPEWDFSGPEFPPKADLMAAARTVFGRHPGTTFIAVHVANWPENLDWVSETLDLCPNVFVDLAERQAELGRQPRRAGRFFADYADRILFGNEATGPDPEKYRSYLRWLETEDEYFDYWGGPFGRWKIYGLGLSDEVLEKVYRTNALAILGAAPG
jgi:predicted TIM-barrel fold metal-dependent hydrolase